ncbi:uncharacterized protein LOC113852159 [Abrus precatorius]|uniref:Uncharacterized protein LOC113852159 n=1 Tax=Abrus precatorius TaxID=3816 RepID=A0A8B8K534_ABRPR|nr:uncharacterized protein LOC113852159 [Abrus precatorius]
MVKEIYASTSCTSVTPIPSQFKRENPTTMKEKIAFLAERQNLLAERQNELHSSVKSGIMLLECVLMNIGNVKSEILNEEYIIEVQQQLEALPIQKPAENSVKEELKKNVREEEKQKLELKQLPSHLQYAFVDENHENLVIINNELKKEQEEKLLSHPSKYKKKKPMMMKDTLKQLAKGKNQLAERQNELHNSIKAGVMLMECIMLNIGQKMGMTKEEMYHTPDVAENAQCLHSSVFKNMPIYRTYFPQPTFEEVVEEEEEEEEGSEEESSGDEDSAEE